MTNALLRSALLSAIALLGCAADAQGGGPIEPPAIEDVFVDTNRDGVVGDPVQVGEANGQPIFETRYYFNDVRLQELCLRPDEDSFDDYEELDSSGNVIIPRGTTPVSTMCPADGIVTGPLHEELLPSSWCRIDNCMSDEASEGTVY